MRSILLNRYEGIPAARIETLAKDGTLSRLDHLSDAAFRKLVPEARDSYIWLRPEGLRLLRIHEREVRIRPIVDPFVTPAPDQGRFPEI